MASYVFDEGKLGCVTLLGKNTLEEPKAHYQGPLGTWEWKISEALELTEIFRRFVHITPLSTRGERLPPVVIEVAAFWYINCMPVTLVGTHQIQNGQIVVILRADRQDYALSGADYWRLIHGERPVDSEYAGILEARLHEVEQAPQSSIIEEHLALLLTPRAVREERVK
jgi:hypothetical protein